MGTGRFGLLLAFLVGLAEAQPKRILYITSSAGYWHASIETSIAVLEDLSRRTGQFEMVATEDVFLLNAASLAQFDGVLFFTSGELPVSESDLLEFVRSDKGFMGVHSATDTFRGRNTVILSVPDSMDILGYNRLGWTWKIPITRLQCLCASHFRGDLPIS